MVIGPIIAIIGAVISFSDFGLFWVTVAGLVLLVVGLIWKATLDIRRPKGELLDGAVQEEVRKLHQQALEKHGITEEQVQRSSPLVLGGYVITEKDATKLSSMKLVTESQTSLKQTGHYVSSNTALASAMGASVIPVDIARINYSLRGIVRSILVEYTIFLFSEEKVFVYTRQFSLIDSEIKESAQVYSYRDIVSVSSETLQYGAHTFIVKVSGGTTLTIPSSNSAAGDIKGSVTAFMQLVREKKGT